MQRQAACVLTAARRTLRAASIQPRRCQAGVPLCPYTHKQSVRERSTKRWSALCLYITSHSVRKVHADCSWTYGDSAAVVAATHPCDRKQSAKLSPSDHKQRQTACVPTVPEFLVACHLVRRNQTLGRRGAAVTRHSITIDEAIGHKLTSTLVGRL